MKILKGIFIVLLILVALLLVVAAFSPSKLHVEQSAIIEKPAYIVFNQVNTLQNWDNWSPFTKNDPEMKVVYEGNETGVGAVQKWESTKNGSGSFTIIESVLNKEIKTELDFMEKGTAESCWLFESTEEGTKVTWTMDSDKAGYPVGRIMNAMMKGPMNKAFHEGLMNLKEVCEKIPVEAIYVKTSEVVEEVIKPQTALAILDSATTKGIGPKLGEIYGKISKYIHEIGIEFAGPPFAIYHCWDEENPEGVMVFEAGFPIDAVLESMNGINVIEIEGGNAVVAYHYGDYSTVGKTWVLVDKYIKENGKVIDGTPWEIYLTDPEKEKDHSKWETKVIYPIK